MKTIEEAFRDYEFYHCVELGPGVVTPGWQDAIPLQQPVSNLIKSLDLAGKSVLDVGCRDGLFSFEVERRGAAAVFGIDNDLSRPAVEFLIPYLQSSVRMAQMNLYDLEVSPDERYDLAIFAGVLYHLRFPFYGLKRIADAVKPGGLMILETAILLSHHRYPFLYCPRPEDSPYEPTSVTFFNHVGLIAAVESVGFVNTTCSSVIADVNGKIHRSSSWDEFVAEQPSVVNSDQIKTGRGTYLCRRGGDEHTVRTNYWYGSHSLHSETGAAAAFLQRHKQKMELALARDVSGNRNGSMSVHSRIILDASQALNLLAKSYRSAGDADRAGRLFAAAADLELASPELQACWGGAFNGQVGRQAIMLDLLELLKPGAVVETGTFRGITVEWLAQHYSGPILSCEKEQLYFLQAQARLERFSNVDVRLEDSRQFLREILDKLPTDKPILVYLDAHWERDLPLRDELASIFASKPRAVAVIDDFKVPDDPGYGWDDYGALGSIELELLKGVIPDDAQLFFPTLSSSDESGARRGCCVIASESASAAGKSTLLRGNTHQFWTEFQRKTTKEVRKSLGNKNNQQMPAGLDENTDSYPQIIGKLQRRVELLSEGLTEVTSRLTESEADRAARLDIINALEKERLVLSGRLSESEADRAARLDAIGSLEAERIALNERLSESEADRAARLDAIRSLEAERMALNERLSESEADRAARLDAIERMEKERLALNERLTESDADRAARLEVINALEKERLALNTRLAALHCEIEGLQQWTDHENVQDDAAARRVLQIARRILGFPVVKLWARLSARSRRISGNDSN